MSADALLVVCVTIWGLNFTVIKYALGHGFNPLTFASMRFTIATGALAGVSFARGRTARARVERRDLLVMLAWSLWLAWSLIAWLKWAFRTFTSGGAWRPVPRRPPTPPKSVPPIASGPPPIPPEAAAT